MSKFRIFVLVFCILQNWVCLVDRKPNSKTFSPLFINHGRGVAVNGWIFEICFPMSAFLEKTKNENCKSVKFGCHNRYQGRSPNHFTKKVKDLPIFVKVGEGRFFDIFGKIVTILDTWSDVELHPYPLVGGNVALKGEGLWKHPVFCWQKELLAVPIHQLILRAFW